MSETTQCAMLFFQVLSSTDKNDATFKVVARPIHSIGLGTPNDTACQFKGLDNQKKRRVFCMLFFEVLPFTTLAVSANSKTSKKSVQKDAASLGVS